MALSSRWWAFLLVMVGTANLAFAQEPETQGDGAKATVVPSQVKCPPGTEVAGDPPPKGHEQWCQKSDKTKHGPSLRWHENGTKAAEGSFTDGHSDRRWVFWFPSGKKQKEGDYKAGKRVGTWLHYDGKGAVVGRLEMKEGTGKWTEWHENGAKALEGTYLTGKRDGAWSWWNESGVETGRATFQSGTDSLTCPSGTQLVEEKASDTSGATDFDFCSTDDEDDPEVICQVAREQHCVKAGTKILHGPAAVWGEDGRRLGQGEFSDGKKHGPWISWNDLIYTDYKNGKRVGTEIVWHSNGKKQSETVYTGNKSKATLWYPDGQKEGEGPGVDGKKEGVWTYYHQNGQKNSQGRHRKGFQDGSWTEWHSNGTKAKAGLYRMGKRVGKWNCWSEEGKPTPCEVKQKQDSSEEEIAESTDVKVNLRNTRKQIAKRYPKAVHLLGTVDVLVRQQCRLHEQRVIIGKRIQKECRSEEGDQPTCSMQKQYTFLNAMKAIDELIRRQQFRYKPTNTKAYLLGTEFYDWYVKYMRLALDCNCPRADTGEPAPCKRR